MSLATLEASSLSTFGLSKKLEITRNNCVVLHRVGGEFADMLPCSIRSRFVDASKAEKELRALLKLLKTILMKRLDSLLSLYL